MFFVSKNNQSLSVNKNNYLKIKLKNIICLLEKNFYVSGRLWSKLTIRKIFMTENTQQSKLEEYINEIIEACKNDDTRLQVAISNFQALCESMKSYDRAPNYYNAILEECGPQRNSVTIKSKLSGASDKNPVICDLEKIYNRKFKLNELKQLAKELSKVLELKLSRDEKRSRPRLLQWFSSNWKAIRPKIFECGLDKMEFEPPKQT